MDTIRVIYCPLPKGVTKVLFRDSKGYIQLVNNAIPRLRKQKVLLEKSVCVCVCEQLSCQLC